MSAFMLKPVFSARTILPRLELDFLSGSLNPIITMSRALNTATAVDQTGVMGIVNANLPRFNYDPVTLKSKGLLVEESRTNLAQFSEDFSDAIWAKNFGAGVSVLADQANGPDGSASLDLITSAGAGAGLFQAFTLAFSTDHTVSLFVREGSSQTSQIMIFNTIAGPVTSISYTWVATVPSTSATTGSPTNITYEDWGGGLYRISFTFTSRSSGDNWLVYVPDTTSGLGTSLAGYAQLEVGSFVTSYIPNVSSGTTIRNADDAVIAGTDFSDWWQAGKGSALVRARPSTVSNTRPLIQFDDTTADNIIALRGNTTNPELYIKATTDQAQIDAGTIAADISYRLAGAWAADNCAASLNGGSPMLDGAATIPVVTQARLGNDGTNYLNGHIEAIEYYDERLPNAYLQKLSGAQGLRSIFQPVFAASVFSGLR